MNLAKESSADQPLVSVIIPTFNCGEHIVDCVESALGQTYSPIEIIVIDNGSTDDTRERLRPFVDSEKIQYRCQQNLGPSSGRNVGSRLARGKYLQFLDGDDLLLPDKIERQVRELESMSSAAICACDFRLFDGHDTTSLYGGDKFDGQFPLRQFDQLFEFETVIHRWLIPAKLFSDCGGFEEDVWGAEDWLLIWKLHASGATSLFIDEPLALYRRHAGTLTGDFRGMAGARLRAIDHVEQYQQASGHTLYSRKQQNLLRESHHYQLGLKFIQSGDLWLAWRALTKALLLGSNRRQTKLLLIALLPILRTRTTHGARAADRKLWQLRSGIRGIFPIERLRALRQSFYEWRQRRPIKRLAAIIAFICLWPLAFIDRRLRRKGEGSQAQRILVIHFGGLGDTLMLTPALRALKQEFPNAKLDMITLHQHVKNAFAQSPRLDSITTLPAFPGKWILSRFEGRRGASLIWATFRHYPGLLLRLLFNRYEVGINFGLCDFDQRVGNTVLYCLDIPTRIGIDNRDSQFLTHHANVSSSVEHRADAYLKFLKPLGIAASDDAYEFAISKDDLARIKLVLREHAVDETRRLAVIQPGGKLHVNSRRWPAEYFARVCEFLFEEGFEVVLTGDHDDATVCAEVAHGCQTEVTSLSGALTFPQTAALLSLADLAITNDTATLHLAEAAGTPRIVSIFGPTDPSLLAPRNSRQIVFRSTLPCAPCMGGTIDANTERCWRDVKEECLWQTTPQQVIAELRGFYGARAARVASA
ncbi:MAG TPA: glycosyltransferase family 9 protein [Pyrinomonadaceae bacterium]|nr:glycosyltransferase family 9 protein [Pyrinomonadaceae bacterium]